MNRPDSVHRLIQQPGVGECTRLAESINSDSTSQSRQRIIWGYRAKTTAWNIEADNISTSAGISLINCPTQCTPAGNPVVSVRL